MKTIDYIKKYGLDKNNKSLSKLEKDEFFKDLEKELLERIQEREKNYPGDLPYKIFQNSVKQVNDKFWAISNKKKGIAFTFELWNAFFAIKVGINISQKWRNLNIKSKITAELETNLEGSAFLILKYHRYETFRATH